MPNYPKENEKLDLKDYKQIKVLTNGKTNQVCLWQHKKHPELKIVVKTPYGDTANIIKHNLKSINAFFGGGSAWEVKGQESFAMKYFEGQPLTDQEVETMPRTILKKGVLFTLLDPNKDNYLKLPSGQIIPIDHDYMILHDGSELLGYQELYLDHRQGFAERVGDCTPEEGAQYVLDSYPYAYDYLFGKWGHKNISIPKPPENLVPLKDNEPAPSIDPAAAMRFNQQLDNLLEMGAKLAGRGHVKAAKEAFKLYERLNTGFKEYSLNPMATKAFRDVCDEAMRVARIELERHRGWKEILGNLGLAIAGLGIGYVVAGVANLVKTSGKHFFFSFNTDSANKLNDLHDTIKQMAPAA
ncbi:hypothetical protein [Legionella brunensis]|uniref:Dot/Icm T4SS effector n=1 Tax=Legionella brunensis TaxID=29422 RepID=A0A0W0SPQ0_9GAMM|nr:hypothetical protein [Legionella brunensis]KTC84997.1 hypothetical protein Lbru_1212 [Legionella brunensis]